ncbi:MAG: HEAT repeat domain-containing protein [Planctomycetota bacterium]
MEKKETDKEKKKQKVEALKDKLAAQRLKEKTATRKKVLRIALILLLIATLFVCLLPHIKVMWYIRQARSDIPENRKSALLWLAERKVKKAVPVFIEALDRTAGESEFAMETLRTLSDNEIIPELLKIWNSKDTSTYAKSNALQLVAEKGDKKYISLFLDTRVLLSSAWDSAWDFLKKHADAGTVDLIIEMLKSNDTTKQHAAVIALRPIKDRVFVSKNDTVVDSLINVLSVSDVKVRVEALRTLSCLARTKDLNLICKLLSNTESSEIRAYAAEVLGELRDSRAVPQLIKMLKDSEGIVCLSSAAALSKIKDPDSLPLLSDIVCDEKEKTLARVQAIEVLRRGRIPGAAAVFSSALKSADVKVAVEAAKSLARTGTHESAPALIEAIKSENSSLKLWSAYSLGYIGGENSSEALLNLLNDKDLEIVKIAVRALTMAGNSNLTGRIIKIFYNLDPDSHNRRELIYLLSIYRTPEALSVLIDSALSAYPELRDESRRGLEKISSDIFADLSKKKSDIKNAIIVATTEMFEKKAGEKLAKEISDADADITAITYAVLNTFRNLHENNKPDRDTLELALQNVRQLFWTIELLDTIRKTESDDGKISSSVQELLIIASEPIFFSKVPEKEIAEKLREIQKDWNLPPSPNK